MPFSERSIFEKRGLVIAPDPHRPWMNQATMLPFTDVHDGTARLYFSGRDADGRARVGSAPLRLDGGSLLAGEPEGPLLDLGSVGAFDESGVTGACIVRAPAAMFLYYAGWTRGVTVPFYDYVGLAISDDDGRTFRRVSRAPILERNPVDPYLTGPPCIRVENGVWRMWYATGTGWEIVDGAPRHRYHIRYAESRDGITWDRGGVVCIDYSSPDEYAIARPMVICDGGRYKMWFSCRGARYRMGYAESDDGIRWDRDDSRAGIEPSDSGWDSEMVAYAWVLDAASDRHMLYCGNGYGRTGIGYATSPKPSTARSSSGDWD